jgi:Predicted amidophosphoribosyltransferases
MQAKAGDEIAAIELVKKCIKKERVIGLHNHYPNAIILPVMAKERTGYNVLPLAFAKVISNISGLRINEDVFQINCPRRTGACAMERLINRPIFDGKVQEGYNYIVLDDVVTQGGTVSSLRRFINEHGAKVVTVSALAFGKESTTIALQQDTCVQILEKLGRDSLEGFLQEKNIVRGVEELTESEGKYLLKFRDVEAIRNRAYEVGVQRILRENGQVFKEKSIAIDRVL